MNGVSVPLGVPQETKLRPWLFLLLINDLNVGGHNAELWKLLVDITASEEAAGEGVALNL